MTLSSNKTVVIAASVLSVLAILQIAVVFSVLAKRATFSHATIPTSPSAVVAENNSKSYSIPAKKNPGIPAATPLPDNLAKSDDVIPDLSPNVVEPSEVDILLTRAISARDKGDMSGALAGLRDGQKLYPDDPKIIAEFATTYEQMGLVDKALVQWKRVADAGAKAGDLYGVAAEKVRMGVIPKDSPSGRDDDGLQPGSTLGLVDVQKNYSSDAEGLEKVSLRVPIKSRPDATIIASNVNIQVMFYDLVNNQEVQPTDAKVTSDWLTAPADWQEEGMEVLRILYGSSSTTKEKPASDRKYLGYIVRLYYENELQDVYAEPVKLLQTFPPSITLQKEIPQ